MVNHLIFHGRLIADPELRDTNSGSKVTNFRVAWSEKYKERENKCFLECKAFGAQAEFIGKYWKKGKEIIVSGKLNTEEWETDGQKRSKIVLIVNEAHFCGKNENGGTPAAPSGYTQVDNDNLPF